MSTFIHRLLDEVHDVKEVVDHHKDAGEKGDDTKELMGEIDKLADKICEFDQLRCEGWKELRKKKEEEKKALKKKEEEEEKLKGTDKDPSLKMGPGGPIPAEKKKDGEEEKKEEPKEEEKKDKKKEPKKPEPKKMNPQKYDHERTVKQGETAATFEEKVAADAMKKDKEEKPKEEQPKAEASTTPKKTEMAISSPKMEPEKPDATAKPDEKKEAPKAAV